MKLARSLQNHGLFARGVAGVTAEERKCYDFAPEATSILLVGNIGSSYWEDFSRSGEYLDGDPHPLDRWSRRVAQAIAAEYGLSPIFPFEGPPYFPFQQWAQRAEALDQSPLGIMMHPEFGLWHSYRFALLGCFPELENAPPCAESPCLSCIDQPCLRTCPVGAFSEDGYAADRCAGYLIAEPQAECHRQGCLARHACPVAPQLSYLAQQSSFHLRAFVDARR